MECSKRGCLLNIKHNLDRGSLDEFEHLAEFRALAVRTDGVVAACQGSVRPAAYVHFEVVGLLLQRSPDEVQRVGRSAVRPRMGGYGTSDSTRGFPCPRLFESDGQPSIRHVGQNAVRIASGPESHVASGKALRHVAHRFAVFDQDIVSLEACKEAVLPVACLTLRNEVLDARLEVVLLFVGVERRRIVGARQVILGRRVENTVHLQFIDTVLQPRQCLVHIHGSVSAQGSPCRAILCVAVFCARLALPAVKAVLEVGVEQQGRHVRVFDIASCNGLSQQQTHIIHLGHNLLLGQCVGFHDVDIAAIGVAIPFL